MINEKPSQVRRFKGMNMEISVRGKLILQKVTSSHFSVENVDKVSRILSSKICENYFATLAKCMEGKRINMDKMNNWIVIQKCLW